MTSTWSTTLGLSVWLNLTGHVRKRRLRITAPSRYVTRGRNAWASLLEYLDENQRTKSTIQPESGTVVSKVFRF